MRADDTLIRRIDMLGAYGRKPIRVEISTDGVEGWRVYLYQSWSGRWVEFVGDDLRETLDAALAAAEEES